VSNTATDPQWILDPLTKHSGGTDRLWWRIALDRLEEPRQYRLELRDKDGDGRTLKGAWEASEDVTWNVALAFLQSKKKVSDLA
jgi:hypothetical protein